MLDRDQLESLAEAQSELASRTIDSQALDLLSWTVLNRTYLLPDRIFKTTGHEYLIGIYKCTAQRMAIMKAGQVGISEYAVSRALHAADVRDLNVFYVMPPGDSIGDFSQQRFGPAIEASPYLTRIVEESNAGDRRGADRVGMRRVRNRFITFRSASVDKDGYSRALKSVPADLAIRDEVDEMDRRVAELVRRRLGYSTVAEELAISTPTYEGRGIHLEWRESDQREWFVWCPHCGTPQYMTIDQIVTEWDDLGRPIAWYGQAEDRAFVACKKCHMELDRLAPGEWVPRYRDRRTAGFHPTKLFAGRTPLIEVVRSLDTVDHTKRKEAFNQDLGLPYAPEGGSISEKILRANMGDYAPGPRPDVRPFIGVDVGRVLHVVIRGPLDPNTGKYPLLNALECSFDELPNVLRRYNFDTCVIDALPETTKAQEIQAQFGPGKVWLCYYSLSYKNTKAKTYQWNLQEKTVAVNRTRTLDAAFARFYEQTAHLPANADQIRDYFNHMQAPVREMRKDASGDEIPVYDEAADPDHYAHAENYALIATERPEITAVQQSQARDMRDLGLDFS